MSSKAHYHLRKLFRDRFGLSRSGPVSRAATRARCFFPIPVVSCSLRHGAIRFSETHKLTWLQSCQPWSYRRLVAYSFLGSCEGALGSAWRLGAEAHQSPNFSVDT